MLLSDLIRIGEPIVASKLSVSERIRLIIGS